MLGVLGSLAILAVSAPQMLTPLPVMSGFPTGAFDNGRGVETFVRLAISPLGKVERCIPYVESDRSFAARVCNALSQAAFSPAKDTDGTPIYGVTRLQLRWSAAGVDSKISDPDVDLVLRKMPSGDNVHPIVQAAVLVDQKGHVEACTVVVSSGVPGLDNATCKPGVADAPVAPATDKDGEKVRSVQSLNVGFGVYAELVLQKEPQWAALGASGPYYPERALRLDVSGYAIIECTSAADGVLTDCMTKDVAPGTFGFDEAAKKMAQTKWMKAAPGSEGHVLIRVDFPPAPDFLARR